MKYVIVLIGSLCCATASDNRIGSAHIVNDTDHTLNVEIGVPKHCQADVTITKIDAQEALFRAIRKDLAKDVRDAVRAGADVNQKIQNKAPLMWAVSLNRIQVTPELLQLGAVVDTECVCAAMKMHSVIVPALVKHWKMYAHAKRDSKWLREVENFVRNAPNSTVAFECVREFIKKGFVIDHRAWDEVVSKFMRAGNQECVFELIKEAAAHYTDVNELWYVALRLGLWRCYDGEEARSYAGEEAVKILLARGANPNHEGRYTPLYLAACYHPNQKIVQLLLAAGADVNKPCQNKSILSYAIEIGPDRKIVQLLLAAGANVNERCQNKSILSIVKARCRDSKNAREVCELLLEYGAEL
jgi:hypothetical protein